MAIQSILFMYKDLWSGIKDDVRPSNIYRAVLLTISRVTSSDYAGGWSHSE